MTRLRLMLSGALLLAAAMHASAQSPGTLTGRVVDRLGRPLVGATITVTDARRGLALGAVSQAGGAFRVSPLPPGGGYAVTVSFPGMSTISLTEITISGAAATDLVVTLAPESEVNERVRVLARPGAIAPDSATTRTTFSSEFIEGLPILGRNYEDVLLLAPGVNDEDGDGSPNIHGARETDVNVLVDGMSIVDPFTGTFGQRLNIEAIDELEVKTNAATAEFGRAQGGFVNVTTKSGSNEIAGSFKFFWRGDRLDGDGAGLDDPLLHGGDDRAGGELDFDDFKPFLSLGGPIRTDKAWFFLTVERIHVDEPVNAVTQAFVKTTRETRAFAKLTWEVSTAHRLALSATLDPQQFVNRDLDSLTAPQSGIRESLGGLNLHLKLIAVFGPNAYLESAAQVFRSRPEYGPVVSPDSNGNGILYVDHNGNGTFEVSERDPGEDFDSDGRYDVAEPDLDSDDILDAAEDRDGDGRRTQATGCEGAGREDRDCDGVLDGGEDRNGDGLLNDRPLPAAGDEIGGVLADGTAPSPLYPYHRAVPLARDRELQTDPFGRVTGPYHRDSRSRTGRTALRQDLSVFLPDWRGQHDLRVGGIVEHESYDESILQRAWWEREARSRGRGGLESTPRISVLAPLLNPTTASAASSNFGFYLQDTYKPLPGLVIGVGVRLDREATEAFGFTPFDPGAERARFDRLWSLAGGEFGVPDSYGDGNGLESAGVKADPLDQQVTGGSAGLGDLEQRLRLAARSRLTQHHSSALVSAQGLAALFPEVITTDPHTGAPILDRERLRAQGDVFQEREAFRLTNHNLAPRLSVSWDPAGAARSRLFATWGRFYDRLFLGTVVAEEGPETVSISYLPDADGVTDAGVPNNGLGERLSLPPADIRQVDRGLQTPFLDEITFGFEKEISPELSLRITAIDRRFRRQLQDSDVNHSIRVGPDGAPRDAYGAVVEFKDRRIFPVPDGRPDLYVHNFFFNRVLRLENSNDARYRACQIEMVKRLSRRWQMEGSYAYSRAVGAAESFDSDLGNDPSVVLDEFGYLDYDERHVLKLNWIAYLMRDWRAGATVRWGSGAPFSIVDRFSALDNFSYTQFRTFYGYRELVDGAWTYVRLPRNDRRNEATWNLDLRLQKAFVLGATAAKMVVSVENALNDAPLRIETASLPGDGETRFLRAERAFGRRFEVGFEFEF